MQSSVSVNWCPALGTVLANEEVINGLSERGDHPVQRLPLRQWLLKITKYADRLEAGLEGLDWPAGTLTAQQQWIGKSFGCRIDFPLPNGNDEEQVSSRTSMYSGLDLVGSTPTDKLFCVCVENHCLHNSG